MKHIIFEQGGDYPVALLVKPQALDQRALETNYVNPLVNMGVNKDQVIAFDLGYNDAGKATAEVIKNYLDELLPVLKDLETKYIYVTDSAYFKALTKANKADSMYGYVMPCVLKGYEHFQVILGVNYQMLFYKPNLKEKMYGGLESIVAHVTSNYRPPGDAVIHFAEYPKTYKEILPWLEKVKQRPVLAIDTEAFSLKFWQTSIATMTMAWSKHEGIAFPVECYERKHPDGSSKLAFSFNPILRAALIRFFEEYKGKILWHNAPFDIKLFIYNLWMQSPTDIPGMVRGLHVMTRHMEDTKIISYLALNSASREGYGLKMLAQEHAGNYSLEEINDISVIPMDKLLEYNLVDGLSTFYVYDKYKPVMIADQQEDIYETLMKPSLKTIIQMELCGMPINMDKVKELKAELIDKTEAINTYLTGTKTIQDFNFLLQEAAMNAANAKLKKTIHPISKFVGVVFNPNSGPQMQRLLYEYMQLPEIDYTESGAPATGGDTLKKLVNHTQNPEFQEIITKLLEFSEMAKILSAFIPAFEGAFLKDDGHYYLHGSFNLGGTVSGRLSSSDPNLQNLPANSTYGKRIKECFMAPPGWIFVGADFNSLEDYVSALTTRDPNKIKVYTDLFDGHCLRAAYYYKDQLKHIDVNDPVSVNSIAKSHKHLRQESKTPTFA